MSRFVILFHADPSNPSRPKHCDVMFESDGMLRTWAITQVPRDWGRLINNSSVDECLQPESATGNTISAEQLADHRLAYLDYEGPVSGDRGSVRRLESGEFTTLQKSPDVWCIAVEGTTIRGEITLHREAETHWKLKFQAHGSAA